jgi:hypothetical protein
MLDVHSFSHVALYHFFLLLHCNLSLQNISPTTMSPLSLSIENAIIRPGKTDGQSPPIGKANPNSESGPPPPENGTPMNPTRVSKPPRMHDSTDLALP